jgi:glycosyltransferase involved in cell wall biosynthesis
MTKYRVMVLAWEKPNGFTALTGAGIYLNYLSKLGKFSRRNGCELDLTFVVPWNKDLLTREDGYEVLHLKVNGFRPKRPYEKDILYPSCRKFVNRLLGDKLPIDLKKFDLIIANSFAFGDFVSRAHLENIIYVSHRPEFLRESIAKKFGLRMDTSRLRRDMSLEAKSVKNSQRVIVVSDACKREFIKHFKCDRDHVVSIHNGVNTSLFRGDTPLQDRKKTIFTYVGRNDPEKGVFLLLKSVKDLVSMGGRNFELRLIMNDGFSLKRKINKLGISKYVKLSRWKKYNELPQDYSRATFTIVPSYWESFSYVSAESLSCGTPVLASAVGSLPEIIGHAGLFFKVGDKEDLTDKLQMACAMPRKRVKKMGGVAKRRVRRVFSAEKFLAKYLKFIENNANGAFS